MAKGEKTRLTAEEILALHDTKTDEVWVEEWGTSVKVAGLTKKQQLDIRTAALVNGEIDADKSQMGIFREGVVEPRFSEDQMPLVFERNAGAVDTIITRILELSGMKPEDAKRKTAEFRPGQ